LPPNASPPAPPRRWHGRTTRAVFDHLSRPGWLRRRVTASPCIGDTRPSPASGFLRRSSSPTPRPRHLIENCSKQKPSRLIHIGVTAGAGVSPPYCFSPAPFSRPPEALRPAAGDADVSLRALQPTSPRAGDGLSILRLTSKCREPNIYQTDNAGQLVGICVGIACNRTAVTLRRAGSLRDWRPVTARTVTRGDGARGRRIGSSPIRNDRPPSGKLAPSVATGSAFASVSYFQIRR